ncbi:MAG: nicotinate phosphoribosyltransferase [Deltaproteobacteria bacterium RIFCSPLOWO2_12_FULL_60_19]|nr:MAG: nicotinate phosphoribosyltransferase [Deltaproteobacteria bacterium RIFCSPLOWO2_12_FULL_60_19]
MENCHNLALLTDLYQLTMAQSYFRSGKFDPATFSLFIRAYPPNRGYFVAAGLKDVLDFLEGLRFNGEAIDYLRSTGLFAADFLDYLKGLSFTGEVWAIAEGRLLFKDEPIAEVTAPIIEAQLVETFIINQINLQMLIATKAARCVHAARGRAVVDFSLRRTHGIDAGLKVARSSYMAGFAGTSNVLAGQKYGIPMVGTMAHSFISSFDREIDAFRSFVATFPDNSILLIDTYDTPAGARKAVEVAREMAVRGQKLRGVRIDSGDLAALAREVRRIFDEAGFHDVKITGSGGLDEYDLKALAEANAPYDSYGVGTRMGVSADAPWFDMAYKLVEYNRRPVLKLSAGKSYCPGKKQIFRFVDGQGRLKQDVIDARGGPPRGGEPLLQKVMDHGKPQGAYPTLKEIRERFATEFSRLDDSFKAIRDPALYPVELSPRLKQLHEEISRRATQTELEPSLRSRRELGES